MDDHARFPMAAGLCYRDPKAALRWLEDAFGFEPFMVIQDREGNLVHSEMHYGDACFMVGSEWSDDHKSPASMAGKNSQSVHIFLREDIDGHCDRAKKAGARIDQEPSDQFYGDRTYRARDLEGHIWTFSVTTKPMTRAEWDAAGDVVTTERL